LAVPEYIKTGDSTRRSNIMTYILPADVDERPISIVGAGTLGRRLAMVYTAGGSEVRIAAEDALLGSAEAQENA
jgi:hypothetical protein